MKRKVVLKVGAVVLAVIGATAIAQPATAMMDSTGGRSGAGGGNGWLLARG